MPQVFTPTCSKVKINLTRRQSQFCNPFFSTCRDRNSRQLGDRSSPSASAAVYGRVTELSAGTILRPGNREYPEVQSPLPLRTPNFNSTCLTLCMLFDDSSAVPRQLDACASAWRAPDLRHTDHLLTLKSYSCSNQNVWDISTDSQYELRRWLDVPTLNLEPDPSNKATVPPKATLPSVFAEKALTLEVLSFVSVLLDGCTLQMLISFNLTSCTTGNTSFLKFPFPHCLYCFSIASLYHHRIDQVETVLACASSQAMTRTDRAIWVFLAVMPR